MLTGRKNQETNTEPIQRMISEIVYKEVVNRKRTPEEAVDGRGYMCKDIETLASGLELQSELPPSALFADLVEESCNGLLFH